MKFIELTFININKKVYYNLANIISFHKDGDYTRIFTVDKESDRVVETVPQILELIKTS
jgi:hypothetical protein